ncbi:GNAT family N-acetyltransferase [Halorubrum ezzemoulense]|uniref:GNAT family N-acetyltransferase n=1 Tax=Halorubrum ezzemoulense TaxID=337243 RepID=UPI00232BCBEB|nr:GNAT family N-acetyltransferase [Halorubrum ezzemoulense]MDB2251373.1 GNAT family N-acetyltransferase [Halorubrum ezzemoulense]
MMEPDDPRLDNVDQSDIIFAENVIGYNIQIGGDRLGAIEGVPGQIENFVVEPHYQGNGVARAALNAFIRRSRSEGVSEIKTNNVTHPAMEHILETEGFEERTDEIGWVKEI